MKERKLMTKKAQVLWALCQREPSVNVGSGITPDTVIIGKRKKTDD
ncbi:MAG: hypothetical protein AB7D38_07750 [Sulfurimonas sp.]